MNYLNNHLNIIHRDLKGANIFLFQNGERIEIKIGDFGHSLNNINNYQKHQFEVGTLRWIVNFKIFYHLNILIRTLKNPSQRPQKMHLGLKKNKI